MCVWVWVWVGGEVWEERMNCQPGEQEGEGTRKMQLGSIKGSQHKQKIPWGLGLPAVRDRASCHPRLSSRAPFCVRLPLNQSLATHFGLLLCP